MISLLFILLSIINIVCLIIVAVHLARDKGLLIAVITALCCQIIPFIWGWAFWRDEMKLPVMLI